jgi:excisionase family DNA binding protein
MGVSASAALTPAEVAEALSVTPVTVRRWLASGELDGTRVGGRLRVDAGQSSAWSGRRVRGAPANDQEAAERVARPPLYEANSRPTQSRQKTST